MTISNIKCYFFVVSVLTTWMCCPFWVNAGSSEPLLDLKDLECVDEIVIHEEYGSRINRADIERYAELKYRESLSFFRDGVLGCDDKFEKIPFIELALSINSSKYELTYKVHFEVKDTGKNKYFEEFTDGNVSSEKDFPVAIRQAIDELMVFFSKSLYKSKGLGPAVE